MTGTRMFRIVDGVKRAATPIVGMQEELVS
jgi:hypothetical protein